MEENSTKPLEIKAARVRLRHSQKAIAREMGISVTAYQKKENGKVRFTDSEKLVLMRVLGLTMRQFNDYFYDGKLPIS